MSTSTDANTEPKNYAEFVAGITSTDYSAIDTNLLHGILGVCSEAGELADLAKKSMFHGRPLEHDKVIDEVGDVLFYIQMICNTLDISVIPAVNKNMKKLKKRHGGDVFKPNKDKENG